LLAYFFGPNFRASLMISNITTLSDILQTN
jgi:hypothetical protein